MAKLKYGERKDQILFRLTKTAQRWMLEQQAELNANGMADVIEKLARQYNRPGDENRST